MWPWRRTRTLLDASAAGDAAAVGALLAPGGADVNARDHDHFGFSPLHHAAYHGHEHVTALLLRAGANVNASDRAHWTPLHWASLHNHNSVVVLLIAGGADPDAAAEEGSTPLHWASLHGHIKVAEVLLKANANPNAKDEDGQTPLHKACKCRRSDVSRLLLSAGADLHAHDKAGKDAFLLCILRSGYFGVDDAMILTLQVLVTFGAKWHKAYDDMVVSGKACKEAPALRICLRMWEEEHAEGLPFTNIPLETITRGVESTQTYINDLQGSEEDTVLRRKICVVGPSCAGKTSLIKSITSREPQLEHIDNRTIGIDQVRLHFEQFIAGLNRTKLHDVTLWDFAGQDAYQVAHSLFFSPRTLFLVCVDLEAFTVAFLQASIMSYVPKQEIQLVDEFIERAVLRWVRLILARQPDAEFVFIITKEDLLEDNEVTGRLLKNALTSKLKEVEQIIFETKQRSKEESSPHLLEARNGKTITRPITGRDIDQPRILFTSCTSQASIQATRRHIEEVICKSKRSFLMPATYSHVLADIVRMRDTVKGGGITSRINRVFAPVETLHTSLEIAPESCRIILQTLHDLGDVLWYEDLGVDLFRDTVILDPLLMIDFIRQVINHDYTGQIMPHADLKALPFWVGLSDQKQMKAMKQVLQCFHLVYSAAEDHVMEWDSDLIVPAYWQTKEPAAWLFLGDILRISKSHSQEDEATRVHWEFHFELGLPLSLFDHLVVASMSPYFKFDAGPDWIVYEEEEIAACRIMVGRDPKSLHRTIHVEAVVAETASEKHSQMLWSSFRQLCGAFLRVLRAYPGLVVSSFAWDDGHNKIGLRRLTKAATAPQFVRWMPPMKTWDWFKQHFGHDD